MLYIYPRVGNVCNTLCVNVLSQKYQTESPTLSYISMIFSYVLLESRH